MPAAPAVPAKPAVAEKRPTLGLLGAGISTLLIVIAAGAWYFLGTKGPAAIVATSAPKANGSQGPTVAVLPFVNESGDASNDALATRLAEDTIGYLGNFSWLRIVGRSAGSTKPGGDPIEAARQIGADYVVSGNVRSGASALHVVFQLDDARSGARIWSNTLEPTAEAIRTGVAEAEVAGRASALIGQQVTARSPPPSSSERRRSRPASFRPTSASFRPTILRAGNYGALAPMFGSRDRKRAGECARLDGACPCSVASEDFWLRIVR